MGSIVHHVEGNNLRILQLMVAVPGSIAKEQLDRGLLQAVRLGHLECMKVLLTAGADINAQVVTGNTPLRVATEHGSLEVLQQVLAAGCDVNLKVDSGSSVLHMAARRGDTKIISALIQAGAHVNCKDNCNNTALLVAAKKGGGSIPVIRCLANFKCDLDLGDSDKRTALHFCAQRGTVPEVLLQAGANPNVQDKDGNSPMHLAATEGFDQIIKTLLEHKANPDITNCFGKTALHYLAMKNHCEAIEAIAHYQGHLDIQDNDGNTPLWYAVDHNRPQAVKALLRCNSKVDPPNQSESARGGVPLKTALEKGYYGLAKLLVLAGCSLESLYLWMDRVRQEQLAEEALQEEAQRLLFPSQQDDNDSDSNDEIHMERQEAIEWFSDWLHTPHSLQQLCRIHIRWHMGHSFITQHCQLPLPPALLNYVTLKEVEDHHIDGFVGFIR